MTDYQDYENVCKEIRATNAQYLDDFEVWLERIGLSEKTVRKHVENIDFYINEYLLYMEPIIPDDGISHVNMFLGYWFIKKTMWSSESSIRGYATSLKKFYTFMNEKGNVDKDSLNELRQTIRDNMPEWLGNVRRYNDPEP